MATRTADKTTSGEIKSPHCGMSLADMPSEIVYMILAHIRQVRRVINCCIALGRLPDDVVLARAVSGPEPFLQRGAPIEFVHALARGRGSIVPASWLEAAVLGGRRDVVAWLHGVADIDRMEGVTMDTWPTIPHARRKQFGVRAQRLLNMAAIRGHVDAFKWLLDFYDAPRFALKPLVDQNATDSLCRYAIASGGAAIELIDTLHRRFYAQQKCQCSPRLARAAARADRVDILDWMYVARCAARPIGHVEMNDLVSVAIDGRAHSMLRWLAGRASRSRIVECLLSEILMPHTPQSRDEAIDTVKRAGLFWSCLMWFCPCLAGIAAGAHGNPQGHMFVRATIFALAYVQTIFGIILMGLFLFSMPVLGVWVQTMLANMCPSLFSSCA